MADVRALGSRQSVAVASEGYVIFVTFVHANPSFSGAHSHTTLPSHAVAFRHVSRRFLCPTPPRCHGFVPTSSGTL